MRALTRIVSGLELYWAVLSARLSGLFTSQREVATPEKPSAVQHVLIGLGVGTGVGGFWGFLADAVSPVSVISSTTDSPCFARSCSLLGAAIGGGYGALVGLTYWAIVTDQEPNAFLGGVAGLVVGSAIGFALGVRLEAEAAQAEARGDLLEHICADVNCIGLGTVIAGGIGTAVGVVEKGIIKKNRTRRDRLRVNIVPQRDESSGCRSGSDCQ